MTSTSEAEHRRTEAFGTWFHDAHGRVTVFVASRCRRCGEKFFPLVETCLVCGYEYTEEILVEARGRLLEFTRVWRAPEGLPTPYYCGFVLLTEGIRVFAQLECGEAGELKAGSLMVARGAAIREDAGNPVTGFKFYPETI